MLELLGDLRFRCNECNTILCKPSKSIDPHISTIDHGENGMGKEILYEANGTICCPKCGTSVNFYISGSEYPQGMFDSTSSSIEGGTFIEEPVFGIADDTPIIFQDQHCSGTRRRNNMLVNELVAFSDRTYSAYGNDCGNRICTHPSGKCSGNCYDCLYEIHYPSMRACQKSDYDCPKMALHYVCQYSYLYTSELLRAFRSESSYLSDFPYYHILSLGCGACPDLMAFEQFYNENNLCQPISYIGIDRASSWTPIHGFIEDYCNIHNIKFQSFQKDVMTFTSDFKLEYTNIIILGYLISYLVDSVPKDKISDFINNIASNVVRYKGPGQKLLLVVNDLNTYRKGRDYFDKFATAIQEQPGINIVIQKYRYVDTGDLYDGQKIGEPYSDSGCLFEIPEMIVEKYKARSRGQKSIQLFLEVQ